MISKMAFEVSNLESNNKTDDKVMLLNTSSVMLHGKLFHKASCVLDNLLDKIQYYVNLK